MIERIYNIYLNRVKNFNVNNKLKVEYASFEDVIPKFQDDFLYCDPPYVLKKNFYSREIKYDYHNNFKHDLLRDLFHQHKGGFILSYNDAPLIKEWYKDYKIIEIDTYYPLGLDKRGKELLIIKA